MKKTSCLTCAYKHRCLKRSQALFHLYIQTGRYDEAELARESLDIGADCTVWEEKKNEA